MICEIRRVAVESLGLDCEKNRQNQGGRGFINQKTYSIIGRTFLMSCNAD